MWISGESWRKRGTKSRAIFEALSSEVRVKFLVVSRARWDEHQRKLSAQKEELRRTLQQNSFSSTIGRQWQANLEEQRGVWSFPERKVIAAMEDYLEGCIDIRVEIETLERLLRREEAAVFSRSSTEKRDIPWQAEGLVGAPRREGGLARELQNEWQDIKYQGIMAKAPPCPERTMKTPLPQQSSCGFLWKTGAGGASPLRMRPKEMLRYLEDSEDLKVGISGIERTDGNAERSRFFHHANCLAGKE